jgi:thioredoxin-like negative regulator of GroEL
MLMIILHKQLRTKQKRAVNRPVTEHKITLAATASSSSLTVKLAHQAAPIQDLDFASEKLLIILTRDQILHPNTELHRYF